MLSAVRTVLQNNIIFEHTIRTEPSSEDLNFTAMSRIGERVSEVEQRRRLLGLLNDGVSGARVLQLIENWDIFMDHAMYNPDRLASERHFSREQLALDRLERLIREERVINVRRRMRDMDGEWTEEISDNVQEVVEH
jgi:hypothetical protein